MKILVLGGGSSNERKVSLRSASNVAEALLTLGHEITRADPAAADFDLPKLVQGSDLVFPILHGAGGEDGTMQQALENLGVRYLGSQPEAMRLTFDKSQYKERLQTQALPVAPGEVVDAPGFAASALSKAPYVLKPICGGSSIDTLLITDPADTPDSGPLFKRYGRMLLEQYIVGREITVGVLGNEGLPIVLIAPPEGQTFDYENKYNGKSSETADPVEVPTELKAQAQDLALHIHRVTGCRHLSRTDMIITPGGHLCVLETNTIPGLTSQSLYPKAAAARGLTFADLMDQFIRLASG